MSLLADLLSKIKQPQTKREVPPNLKSIVLSSASRSAVKRKIIILSGLVLLFVLAGIIAVYFINSVADTSDIQVTRPQLITDSEITPDKQVASVKAMKGTEAEQSSQTRKTMSVRPVKIPPKKLRPKVSIPDSASVETKNIAKKTALAIEETRDMDIAVRDAMLYKARKFEMKHDYSSALGTYKNVLKMDSDNVTVLNNIAYIYLKLGLVQESMQYALMAVELDVDYNPALINLGIAYAKSGNVSAAENYLNRAFKREPDNKNAILNLALLHEKKQNYSGAASYFSKLIKLGDSAGTFGLARIYEKQGRNTEALTFYKKALSLEHLDQPEKIQIRQRMLVLRNKGKRAEGGRPATSATDATQ